MDGFDMYFRGGIDRSQDGLSSGDVLRERVGSKTTPIFPGGTSVNSINMYWEAQPAPPPLTVC